MSSTANRGYSRIRRGPALYARGNVVATTADERVEVNGLLLNAGRQNLARCRAQYDRCTRRASQSDDGQAKSKAKEQTQKASYSGVHHHPPGHNMIGVWG